MVSGPGCDLGKDALPEDFTVERLFSQVAVTVTVLGAPPCSMTERMTESDAVNGSTDALADSANTTP